jgi:hypothetical protein
LARNQNNVSEWSDKMNCKIKTTETTTWQYIYSDIFII